MINIFVLNELTVLLCETSQNLELSLFPCVRKHWSRWITKRKLSRSSAAMQDTHEFRLQEFLSKKLAFFALHQQLKEFSSLWNGTKPSILFSFWNDTFVILFILEATVLLQVKCLRPVDGNGHDSDAKKIIILQQKGKRWLDSTERK